MSVAVVIPVYNHERYIGAAIQSVYDQTRPVDAVIVVNDGSTDGSNEAVKRVANERLTLLTQENAGFHAAMQRGLETAAGHDFIAILNSDDVFHPDRVKRCLEHLEAHPEHEMVCTGLRLIDDGGAPLAPEDPKAKWLEALWQTRPDDLCAWLGVANFTKTSSNFVARSRFLLAHPFGDYRYVPDYHVALHCALRGQLGLIDEVLFSYRTHPTNTIKSGGLEAVTTETLRMNFDLLRELAPLLAADPDVRARYVRYYRELMQNHADFRAEVFVTILAQSLPAGIPIRSYPELGQRGRGLLKKQLAASRKSAEREERLRSSRWLQLGRKLGFISPDLFP